MALLPLLAAAYVGSAAEAFSVPNPSIARCMRCDGNLLTPRGSERITCTPSATRLNLFGNIFGAEVEEDQKDLQEDELARFSHLVSSDDNPDVKFDSLSIMIKEWAKLVADPEKKMLTTPVSMVELASPAGSEDITDCSGVQLLFTKTKTGGRSAYQDKDDEKNEETKEDKEENSVKEGGVEVRVEQLTNGDLQVVASRCEIEEGTMRKEMSEQTIIDSLRKAMAAWKKEQQGSSSIVSSPWS
ncbi:hypothetical protein ACHAXT_009756 [Thalassiosira profunda]